MHTTSVRTEQPILLNAINKTEGTERTLAANLLRRWVHETEMKPRSGVVHANVVDRAEAQEPKTVFVPVSLPAPVPTAQAPDIRIELRRGPTKVTVTWSAGSASDCAVWIRKPRRFSAST
jgi:hypothetical protein